jgi:glucan biosynthesis protein
MAGSDEFDGRFMQFNFSPPATSKAVVSIHGRLEGNSIKGTFRFRVYDLQGHLLFSGGHGTFVGKRFAA